MYNGEVESSSMGILNYKLARLLVSGSLFMKLDLSIILSKTVVLSRPSDHAQQGRNLLGIAGEQSE